MIMARGHWTAASKTAAAAVLLVGLDDLVFVPLPELPEDPPDSVVDPDSVGDPDSVPVPVIVPVVLVVFLCLVVCVGTPLE